MKKKLSVLIMVNSQKKLALKLLKEIQSYLEKNSEQVSVHSFSGKPDRLPPLGHFDVAFSLGGDGTVLYTARVLAPRHIPIIPVNLGSLGFLANVRPEEWLEVFTRWKEGSCPSSDRMMLEVKINRGNKSLGPWIALNDVVISSAGISKIIRLKVGTETVDFGSFRADGLIVASPTGSTGYSVAAGGPIVDPEMQALIINPICPFTLSNRPLVLPATERLKILLEKNQRSDILFTLDGQEVQELEEDDLIIVSRSGFTVRIIENNRFAFYTALRNKLNWSGGPDA